MTIAVILSEAKDPTVTTDPWRMWDPSASGLRMTAVVDRISTAVH
jgi:hypothetical protein